MENKAAKSKLLGQVLLYIAICIFLQRLAAATKRFSWELNFPKIVRNLDN